MRRAVVLIIIVIFAAWLACHIYLQRHPTDPDRRILWGVTFSESFSKDLGLDWKANYRALLDDAGVRHLRIPAYWNLVEPSQDSFDFTDLDYQVEFAAERHADIILTVGAKAPRWPECYYPAWTNALTEGDRRQALLDYERAVITRYKDNPAIRDIQIENEPYLPFGDCAYNDVPSLLPQEIAQARSIDAKHPLLVTASIFVDPWYLAARAGDIFGTSMYLSIYNDHIGYIHYPLPPSFFKMKEAIVRALIHDHTKPFIVIELQAEPWIKNGLTDSTAADQLAHFSIQDLQHMIDYAKDTGYDEYYLWGAEWWYWMKTTQHHPEFWDGAKNLFAVSS